MIHPTGISDRCSRLSGPHRDPLQVFEGKGSRYGPVAPLKSLEEALEMRRPFAVVAKPCDVNAVRNLATVDPRVDELCKCLLTLSCGTYADNVCVDKFLEESKMKHSEVEEGPIDYLMHVYAGIVEAEGS